MNRCRNLRQTSRKASSRAALSRSGLYRPLASEETWQWFCPLHFQPHYRYPLLVWLHSNGTDEQQLLRLIRWISLRNYVAVAPRAPLEIESEEGFFWPDVTSAGDAWERVHRAITETRQRYSLPEGPVYLAGLYEGGTMALYFGLQHAGCIQGAASIHGPFPRNGTALTHLEKARKLPIWIAQGATSQHYPSDQLIEDMRLLHTAGLDAHIRQYSCDDSIHLRMLEDLDRWIVEQSAGAHLVR